MNLIEESQAALFNQVYLEIRERLDKKIKISDIPKDGQYKQLVFSILKGKTEIGQVQIDIKEGEIIVAHMDEEILYETWYGEEDAVPTCDILVEEAVNLIEENYERFCDIHTNLKKVHDMISKIEDLLDDINLDDYIEFHYRYQQFDV
jgi:hypothetical protein